MKHLQKLLVASLLTASTVSMAADDVTLSLNMYINDDLVKPIVLKGQMGQNFTAQIDGEVKYNIIPSMENDSINISTVFYVFRNGKYVIRDHPVLVTPSANAATLEIDTKTSKVYKIQITPEVTL